MRLVYKRLVPLVYRHIGLHIVSDALAGKKVIGIKVLRNAVPERTANFGWPAEQQVRDCVFIFYLRLSFCAQSKLLSQIMRLDMTYRIVNQSINIEPLRNMGFTTISLSSNVNNSMGFAKQLFMQ